MSFSLRQRVRRASVGSTHVDVEEVEQDVNSKGPKVGALGLPPTESDELFLPEPTSARVRKQFQKRISSSYAGNTDEFTKFERATPKFLHTPRHIRLALLGILTVLSLAVHFYKLSEPSSVVFDEVHFGKFTNDYLQRKYFFDVHPPVAKLMLAAAGYFRGYDGKFPFKKIHQTYINQNVPYIFFRSVSALCGTALVPVSYLTVSHLGFSAVGATLAATTVLFENLFVTQTRLILLDAPLLLFTACTVYASIRFFNLHSQPFTGKWWLWLALSGIFLGLSVSVKWVGLFVMGLLGFKTVYDLWTILGDRSISMHKWTDHFLARLVCLLAVPIVIYFWSFYIHLSILNTNGPGSAFMSREFRDGLYTLVESDVSGIPAGAQITLMLPELIRKDENDDAADENKDGDNENTDYIPGYLHSHNELYPLQGSSLQQQVTGYDSKDHNNWFVIDHADHDVHDRLEGADFIHANETVILKHAASHRALYVHGFPGPVTEKTLEVSAFDGDGHGWRISVVSGGGRENKDGGKLLVKHKSKIRFHNDVHSCVLTMTGKQLPDWGLGQREVVCAPEGMWNDKNSAWSIDEFIRADGVHESYSPPKLRRNGLWTRLMDISRLQAIAWDANRRLTAKHVYGSRPQDWPILKRGISYWQNRPERRQIYLLGNPAIFGACLLSLPIYVFLSVLYALRARRGYRDMDGQRERRFWMIGYLWLGYALHYVPFFFMDRQLFLHHYLPAHYFAILAMGCLYDHCAMWLRRVTPRVVLAGLIGCFFVWWFWKLSPLAYSTPGLSVEESRALRLRKTWDFF
eukprot:comp20170_c1_seq1/m.24980 comp20170_c1_seq1/g.24980  ORF comp20170_c1_seq1/g.24980 comp20170_c1_seq1/m.24980 type:complete len:802 (-) comp20170_c1_seq1:294-2699(-)